MSEADTPGIEEHLSPVDFPLTLERLVHAIETAGLTLFATIDHAANAREAGLALRFSTVLIYGHARGGTPVMQAAPLAALDLPLRVLAYEKPDGRTAVAFRPVVAMLRSSGAAEDSASRLAPAQRLLVAALAP